MNAPSENFMEDTIEERNPYIENGTSVNIKKGELKNAAIPNVKTVA